MKNYLASIVFLCLLFSVAGCSKSKSPHDDQSKTAEQILNLAPDERFTVRAGWKELVVLGKDVLDWVETTPQAYCGRFEYDWSKPTVISSYSTYLVISPSGSGKISAVYEYGYGPSHRNGSSDEFEKTPLKNLQISGNRFVCDKGHGRFVILSGISPDALTDNAKKGYDKERQTWLGVIFDMDVEEPLDDQKTTFCFWALRRIMVEGEYDNSQAMYVPETGDVGGIKLSIAKKGNVYDVQCSEIVENPDGTSPQVRKLVVNETMNTASFEFLDISHEWISAQVEFVREGAILRTKKMPDVDVWFLPRHRGGFDDRETTAIVDRQTSIYDSARGTQIMSTLPQYSVVYIRSRDEVGEENAWSSVRFEKNNKLLEGYIPDSTIAQGTWAMTLQKVSLFAAPNSKSSVMKSIDKHTVLNRFPVEKGDFVLVATPYTDKCGYIRKNAVTQ